MLDNGYTKKEVRAAKAASSSLTPDIIVAIYIKLMNDGALDYNIKHAAYWAELNGTSSDLKPLSESIKTIIDRAVSDGMDRVGKQQVQTTTVKKQSPQEKVFERAKEAAKDIDKWLQNYKTRGWDINSFNFRDYFTKLELSPQHVKKISSFYQSEFSDLDFLVKNNTKTKMKNLSEQDLETLQQIEEGYNTLTKTELTRYYNALKLIVEECDAFANNKKAARQTRKSKPRDVEKAVAKLKFKANDVDLNLTSVKPENIVGASQLWVYNTKTRKLGCYYATTVDPSGMRRPGFGLAVKGTVIEGFDPALSVQKTVRKPEETMREFSAANKNKLNKFLDTLSTVESKMNGRINADTILLRVF